MGGNGIRFVSYKQCCPDINCLTDCFRIKRIQRSALFPIAIFRVIKRHLMTFTAFLIKLYCLILITENVYCQNTCQDQKMPNGVCRVWKWEFDWLSYNGNVGKVLLVSWKCTVVTMTPTSDNGYGHLRMSGNIRIKYNWMLTLEQLYDVMCTKGCLMSEGQHSTLTQPFSINTWM